MKPLITVTSRLTSVPFNIFIIRKGEAIPHWKGHTHQGEDPLVSFYDARGMPGGAFNPQGTRQFSPLGQYIATYELRDLEHSDREHRGLGLAEVSGSGWRLDAESVHQVVVAVRDAIRTPGRFRLP